jgi:4-hydroxy-3-polyprenylbenzoate decarboxylase
MSAQRRVVVGITGATGAVYAVRLLRRLREAGRETHLIASAAGVLSVHHELGLDRRALEQLADVAYAPGDVGAAIASGSFAIEAMVVAPCSMKSLAAIALGMGDNLLTRAADVTLKERRRLVLMVRETPFNLAHLRNMTAATEMGAVIFPPAEPRRSDRRHCRAGARAARRRRGGTSNLGRAGREELTQPSGCSQALRAPNTAFGYCGLPRLPL